MQCKVMQGHATLRKVMQRYANSCNVPQGHAKSCNVTQGHATYRKIMQRHARSCKVMSSCKVIKTPAWSTLLSCCDVLHVFSLFQEVGERWLSTTGGLRNLSWSFLCCFFQKPSLFTGHSKNLISSHFAQLMNVKGHSLQIQIEAIWC